MPSYLNNSNKREISNYWYFATLVRMTLLCINVRTIISYLLVRSQDDDITN